MKKIILTLATLVCVIACAFGFAACGGSDGSKALGFRLKTDDTYAVDSVPLKATTITIPSTYEGKPVTSIDTGAFGEHTKLKSLTIPDSVTLIEAQAFYDCTKLENITIPDSVTSVGESAFHGTVWYENQPDGIVYAGKAVYRYKGTVPNNTPIVIADETKSITEFAFGDCGSLTSVTIPDSVTSINSQAFYNCGKLTSIAFNGTKAQWNAIKKGSRWNDKTGDYKIHCTDGDITKS